jgi:NAD(P)-dependent dehydrogenase (short-subunit alcohol dehydrogenase family)
MSAADLQLSGREQMAQRKTALVTGGTGGLGSAVTARLLADGWRVVVPWIVDIELDRLSAHRGNPDLVLLEADLFDQASTAGVVDVAATDRAAPLFAVVNLVGGFAMGPRVHEYPVDEFEKQLRLNLRPTYLTTQATLPHLIAGGGGSIVCMSTRAAIAPFSGASGYIASKAAVLAFVSALAVEYKGDRIRANALLPTVIDTPANRDDQPDAARKGWVDPIEIAQTVAYLVGPSSSAVSGAHLPVPGVG